MVTVQRVLNLSKRQCACVSIQIVRLNALVLAELLSLMALMRVFSLIRVDQLRARWSVTNALAALFMVIYGNHAIFGARVKIKEASKDNSIKYAIVQF